MKSKESFIVDHLSKNIYHFVSSTTNHCSLTHIYLPKDCSLYHCSQNSSFTINLRGTYCIGKYSSDYCRPFRLGRVGKRGDKIIYKSRYFGVYIGQSRDAQNHTHCYILLDSNSTNIQVLKSNVRFLKK